MGMALPLTCDMDKRTLPVKAEKHSARRMLLNKI